VGKTKVIYVAFLRDGACQKLLKSVSTVFFETRCMYIRPNEVKEINH